MCPMLRYQAGTIVPQIRVFVQRLTLLGWYGGWKLGEGASGPSQAISISGHLLRLRALQAHEPALAGLWNAPYSHRILYICNKISTTASPGRIRR
jgi:hypothetical protein